MVRCLGLIQGLLLLHRRSQRLFARKSSLEVRPYHPSQYHLSTDDNLSTVPGRCARIESALDWTQDSPSFSERFTSTLAYPLPRISSLLTSKQSLRFSPG